MREGWKVKKLSELSKNKDAIVSGPFGSNLKVSDYKESGIPILRLQNIGKGHFIEKDIKFINEAKAEELKYHSFIAGDIVLAKLGIPVGKTCIIPNHFHRGIIVADVVRIRPDKKIINYKFLEYFLNTDLSVSQLTKNISGSTRPRVNLSNVRNIELNLPPLPEQKRIVAILDKAFAAIAKAKANAEQNLKNAKELFESYLNEVFENGNWETRKLEKITEVKDGTHDSPKYIKDGIPFITQKNIKANGLSFDDTKFITTADHEKFYKRSNVSYGDILISMIGANRGMAAIVDDKRIFSIKNVGLIKFCELYNSSFLIFFLKSKIAKDYVFNNSKGSAQGFIGLGKLRNFDVPWPPISEQEKIVKNIRGSFNRNKKT